MSSTDNFKLPIKYKELLFKVEDTWYKGYYENKIGHCFRETKGFNNRFTYQKTFEVSQVKEWKYK